MHRQKVSNTLESIYGNSLRMKTCIFIMLFAACSAHCNVTSTCNPEDIAISNMDVAIAIDMISNAKCYISNRNNCMKAALKKPVDCADVLDLGHKKSGVYEIWPMNRIFEGKSILVYCDMDTDGGGWTVIQRRGDFKTAKDYFFRNWENYKEGFGNIKQDFWLGNDKIFALTNQKLYSVRFDLEDVEQNTSYAVYDKFWIDDEERLYTLHISLYSGKAGDSMDYHNNQRFSTFDNDNGNKCPERHKGGWWYVYCKYANLNGIYHKGKDDKNEGVSWYHWKGYYESLLWTEIKIRPRHFRPAKMDRSCK